MRALVVGGSRGLGELTAKLIAAGGGRVAVTYAQGREDAETVAREISKVTTTTCSVHQYEVQKSASEQLERLDFAPSEIYYFATPPIFRRTSGAFDQERLAEFNQYYISAFFSLVSACRRLSPNRLRVFFPSTSAIDQRPPGMTEYTMSKAAAEILCQDLNRIGPKLRILLRRLPRLQTDQTNSEITAPFADSIEVILGIVREMQI